MINVQGKIIFLLLLFIIIYYFLRILFLLILFYRYSTRDAFMIKVMSKQNFTQYPYIVKQLKEVEAMFEEIQKLHRYFNTIYFIIILT